MKQKNLKSNKIRVGVVGEHPINDSEALCHLLRPFACHGVQFMVVLKNERGGQLDNDHKFLKALESEFINEELNYVILIRDLDGILAEKEKVIIKSKWFERADKTIENRGIFFLAIAEMEALILSNIENVNKLYKLKLKPISNPMTIKDPKKKLMELTDKTKRGKYTENDAPDIFKTIDFKSVYKNHKGDRSFQTFADELKDKKSSNLRLDTEGSSFFK